MSATNVKPVYSPDMHIAGLNTLNALWSRGIAPNQVKPHWLLTWYALRNCNLKQTAKIIHMHRNSLIAYCNKNMGLKRLLPLRRRWQKILRENSQETFENQFLQFWEKTGLKIDLSAKENANLIGLWKTGFPYYLPVFRKII